MNSFNPMHYADAAMVLGVALIALGTTLLGLVVVLCGKGKEEGNRG